MLPQLVMEQFDTLPIQCRHIEHMHEGVCFFFCSGIQFYVLLSPYLCFISFLYLDLYALGDDAWIS